MKREPGDGDADVRAPDSGLPRTRATLAWGLLAAAIYSIAIGCMLKDAYLEGGVLASDYRNARVVAEGDVTFEAWLVARNAYTLLRHPQRLFDSEHCAPDENTLTLGIPMITMGFLGIPASLVTDDPRLVYNFALATMTLIAALALFLLVAEWTRIPGAGLVAGLLYAFGPARLSDIHHPSVWDTSWLVLSLFFAQRLFASGRWRDAVGLALACSLQIGASFYPLLAAAFATPPFLIWLLYRDGLRQIRPSQIVLVLGVVLLAAIWLLGPYLDARASPTAESPIWFVFARWSDYLPGGLLFPGWAALLLALIGVAAPRSKVVSGIAGDPRWALIAGSLIVVLIAAGGHTQAIVGLLFDDAPIRVPNFYLLASQFIPGLDSVRGVLRLTAAAQVAICILAGMGAAWLIDVSRRWASLTVAVLLLLSAVSVFGLPVVGIDAPHRPWEVLKVDVPPQAVAFFRTLEERGNRGPILELPAVPQLWQPKRILLSAYHHRRTSACFGSYGGPSFARVTELGHQLPAPEALSEVRELGFTTLILHHPKVSDDVGAFLNHTMRELVKKVKRQEDSELRLVHRTAAMTAYEIRGTLR